MSFVRFGGWRGVGGGGGRRSGRREESLLLLLLRVLGCGGVGLELLEVLLLEALDLVAPLEALVFVRELVVHQLLELFDHQPLHRQMPHQQRGLRQCERPVPPQLSTGLPRSSRLEIIRIEA